MRHEVAKHIAAAADTKPQLQDKNLSVLRLENFIVDGALMRGFLLA